MTSWPEMVYRKKTSWRRLIVICSSKPVRVIKGETRAYVPLCIYDDEI